MKFSSPPLLPWPLWSLPSLRPTPRLVTTVATDMAWDTTTVTVLTDMAIPAMVDTDTTMARGALTLKLMLSLRLRLMPRLDTTVDTMATVPTAMVLAMLMATATPMPDTATTTARGVPMLSPPLTLMLMPRLDTMVDTMATVLTAMD